MSASSASRTVATAPRDKARLEEANRQYRQNLERMVAERKRTLAARAKATAKS